MFTWTSQCNKKLNKYNPEWYETLSNGTVPISKDALSQRARDSGHLQKKNSDGYFSYEISYFTAGFDF